MGFISSSEDPHKSRRGFSSSDADTETTQTPNFSRQSNDNPHPEAKYHNLASQTRTTFSTRSSLRKSYLPLVLILYCLVSFASAKCDVCRGHMGRSWGGRQSCKNLGCTNGKCKESCKKR